MPYMKIVESMTRLLRMPSEDKKDKEERLVVLEQLKMSMSELEELKVELSNAFIQDQVSGARSCGVQGQVARILNANLNHALSVQK